MELKHKRVLESADFGVCALCGGVVTSECFSTALMSNGFV